MRGNWVRVLGLPLLLASVAACASNAVPAGVVYTSGTPSGYGSAPAASPTYPASGQTAVTVPATPPAQGSAYGVSGRVVSIREVAVQGGGGGGNGAGNGTFVGGLMGAMSGAAIGGATSRSVGGGIVGGLIGLVGGAIIGTIAEGNHGAGTARGIEVTVQRDDGQQVTVAQRDEGDIQLGDRVQVVQNRQGTAQVVRDNSRSLD